MTNPVTDSWRRMRAAAWARSLEFLRDKSAVGWNVVFPILLVLGLAYIFSGPGQPMFKVGVLAPAGTVLDTTLHPFFGTPQVQFYLEDQRGPALHKVQLQRIDMLLDLITKPGRYWVNDQSPKGKLLEQLLHGAGGEPLQRQATTGAQVHYVDWVAPGVLAMSMMFSCLFGIGYVIVRYRKNGYLKRLNATPLRAFEFLLAQLVSRLVLIVLVNALVFSACRLLLHLRMEGSYWALIVLTVLAAFAMIAMGLVVSARISSEELAGGILNVIATPMMVICGVFFSIDGAPRALQIVAQLLPLTHLVNGARAIMLDGADLRQIAPNLLALAAMSLFYLLLGATLFKWRQD